ncbi:hypothetical protein BVIET440_260031 [Burkholderia vietnamiensis]
MAPEIASAFTPHRTDPRCNKLLLYGPKPRFYYSPRFSLNLINYRIGDISFQIVIRSFRFY